MRLRALALSVPLSLLLPLAAAAITLDPVPWTSAGFDDTTPPRLSDPGIRINCSGTECPSGPTVTQPFSGDEFSAASGSFTVQGERVSEVFGNTWTFGYRNLEIGPDPDTSPGIDLASVTVAIPVSAVLDVPEISGQAFTDLLFANDDPELPRGVMESELFGFGDFPAVGPVTTFVAGDRLHVFTSVSVSLFHDDDIVETFGSCGYTDAIDLSDCTFSLEVFRPVASVPEPQRALLLVLPLALGLFLRARRA